MGSSASKSKPAAASSQASDDSAVKPPNAPPSVAAVQPVSAMHPVTANITPAESSDSADPNLHDSATTTTTTTTTTTATTTTTSNNDTSLTPGKKQVAVLRVNNPEDYEDDTNQTGQSHYELKIQDGYYSTPNRPRSRAVTEAMEAARAKKLARAQRKADKRTKGNNKNAAEQLVPHTVPWVIENAKRLGILNLSKMGLQAMPDVVFESVPGTTRIINISNNKMTAVDERLCDYVLVQRLIANDNMISCIPNKICRMVALKKLDLSCNKLSSLPDGFQRMRDLNHVDLSHNMLSSLPRSFCELPLKVLNLSHNKFSRCPLEIANMKMLEDVNISHNELTSVPDEYAGMERLRVLCLDSNRLTDFPDCVLLSCLDMMKLGMRGNTLKAERLQGKEAFLSFEQRRRTKYKWLLDAGSISTDDLVVADS